MWSLSISASMIYKNGGTRQGITGCTKRILSNLVENKLDCKRNFCERRNFFEIRRFELSTWWKEWRECKYSKLTKRRFKNWERITETFQQLTSQLQKLQEQMNSIEQFWRIQEYWIKLWWKIVSRFQSTWDDSEFSCFAQPRQKIAAWYMESIQSRGKGFWKSIFYVWFTSRFSSENFIWNMHRNRDAYLTNLRRKQVWQVETDTIMAQLQCRSLRQDGWLRVLQYRWNYRRIMSSDSKDSNCRNYKLTNSLRPHHSWCGRPDSKHWFHMVLIFRRQLCYGSMKWRWLILWMSGNPHDQCTGKIFWILRCWRRRLPRLWTRSSRIPSSKRSSSKSKNPKKRIGFREGDKSLSWFTTTFDWLALMTVFWIMLILSRLLFMMTIFRNSIRDGTKFCSQWVLLFENRPAVLSLGKLCENHGYSHHWTSG